MLADKLALAWIMTHDHTKDRSVRLWCAEDLGTIEVLLIDSLIDDN